MAESFVCSNDVDSPFREWLKVQLAAVHFGNRFSKVDGEWLEIVQSAIKNFAIDMELFRLYVLRKHTAVEMECSEPMTQCGNLKFKHFSESLNQNVNTNRYVQLH